MDIELFTDGDWRNTHLVVDGIQEKFVTRIDIFAGDRWKAAIGVKSSSGLVPYGSVVRITGARFKSDENGHPVKTPDRTGLQREQFEYKNVNIYDIRNMTYESYFQDI